MWLNIITRQKKKEISKYWGGQVYEHFCISDLGNSTINNNKVSIYFILKDVVKFNI